MLVSEGAERENEKHFLNGEVYTGIFKGIYPHGRGKYVWSSGTVYDGDWEDGKMTGKGKIIWSSGSKYEGDFSGGYFHGYGTFTSTNGSIYRGTWRMNVQHGMGRKEYSNSGIYVGVWKEGLREGSGKYSWNDGSMYIGNWKKGKMCGRGVMRWDNGDVFYGFWLNGFRHGSGVYRFKDGGFYFGLWSRGLKDGKGTFYPAGSKHPSFAKLYNSFKKDSTVTVLSHNENSEIHGAPRSRIKRSLSERISVGSITKGSGCVPQGATSLDAHWRFCDPTRECVCHDTLFFPSHNSDGDESEAEDKSTVVYEREYMHGVLIQERVRNYSESADKSKWNKTFTLKEAKKRSRVDIFEDSRSYYLMLNLQLGIRYTVGKITPMPMREVRSSDFGDQARIKMYFPRKGSQFTPPHYSVDFYWKDYCPMVFRNLRELFKLDAAEYMMSICGDDGLTELSSPGKSGSIFYLSHDDRFVIKTLKKFELKTLLKMLSEYYHYVKIHENTLITKFFGLHRIKLRSGKKVRFVVMGNMFCTELRIHHRYDLKGSRLGRCTDEAKIHEKTTLKDLDLNYEFYMDKFLRDSLFKQIYLDCAFLESQQIIDYSLLLGVHLRAPENLKICVEPPGSLTQQESLPGEVDVAKQEEALITPKGLLLVMHEPRSVNTAPGPHIRGSTLRAYSAGDKEVDLLLPGTARLRVQLGVNMPAQAFHKVSQDVDETTTVKLFERYDAVLYIGIIDILQEYNMKKRIEHAYKSLQYDPLSISVAEPKVYMKRFINFLEKVFLDVKEK